jgi:hypothetical protein
MGGQKKKKKGENEFPAVGQTSENTSELRKRYRRTFNSQKFFNEVIIK